VDYTTDVNQYINERGLGPDALALTSKEFKDRFAGKKNSIKSALMDQKLLAGIGNVYSDEILFQARVHPQDRVDRLGERILQKIYETMKSVLNKTIRYEADPHRVCKGWLLPHREKGANCPRCGKGLDRVAIMQRSAYVCPNCQRRRV